MSKTMGIRLDDSVQARLKALGKVLDRSPHHLLKQAVIAFISEEERKLSDLRDMQERWEAYATTGKSISHEEMLVWADEAISKDQISVK